MAIDLKGINKFPYFYNFTATTTATEIYLPAEARTISFGSETKALYIAQNNAVDGDAMPSHKGFVPSGNYIQIKLGIGLQRASMFLAVKSGSGDVSIILEEQ